MKIITDGRTLRAMVNSGCIAESNYSMFPQVDHNENDDWRFSYNNKNYKLKYLDGSFFPFVFEVKQ